MIGSGRLSATKAIKGIVKHVACGVGQPLGVRRHRIEQTDYIHAVATGLYSWWVNPGETDALAALLNVYKEAHPNTTVSNATVGGTVAARAQLRERMIGGLRRIRFWRRRWN
jgi:hypothetical protein